MSITLKEWRKFLPLMNSDDDDGDGDGDDDEDEDAREENVS